MSDNVLADQVWRTMAAVVFENRDTWKRTVVEQTGLRFSRIRLLRRLAKTSLTATELAAMAGMDAPATSVAVSDLEERGLVVREMDQANRRRKLISLTDGGRAVIARIDQLDDPAPAVLAALGEDDLRALQVLLAKLKA